MDSLAIERFVDENGLGIKELLQKTVDIYSPSCDAASVTAVGDVFAEELRGLGFHVSRPQGDGYGAHVLADLDTGKPGPKILLMGHMDTVELPAAGYDYRMRVDGDLIRGLGVQDMKGGDVILTWALRALKNAGGLTAGWHRLDGHPPAVGTALLRLEESRRWAVPLYGAHRTGAGSVIGGSLQRRISDGHRRWRLLHRGTGRRPAGHCGGIAGHLCERDGRRRCVGQ